MSEPVSGSTRASSAITAAKAGHRLGFQSMEVERELDSLVVEGVLPEWLAGSLYRVGPAKFEAGGRSVNHWFDGFSMLHRFTIGGGRISYANRFLESKAYRAASEGGELSYSEFATDPCRTRFGRLAAAFHPKLSDNANVNLARLGEELVAMTETPLPIVFDPETLRAAGVASPAPGEQTTAHPHRWGDEALFYAVKFGPRSRYRLYARRGTSGQRRIAQWGSPRPSYMHSFGLSARYAVLAECPFAVNPRDLAISGRPFIENFRWRGDRPTVFTVIDLESGELRARVEGEPFFCFHHVNAFEQEGELVVDLIAYEDAGIVESLYLEALRAGRPVPRGELRRYSLPLDGGEARRETIATDLELPRIDYARCNGRPYRYVYGNSAGDDMNAAFLGTVRKVDVNDGSTADWRMEGTYPGEPVFVAAPGARAEDDGVLLLVVLEPARDTSFLAVLDASDMSEICRARVPHAVPFGFHGAFFAAS